MKVQFSRFKKALEHIDKHSDKGDITIRVVDNNSVYDAVWITFNALAGDNVMIEIPADERAFSKIHKTERF